MITEILQPTEENIRRSADIIKSGNIVAMPTETVYGLAADAFCEDAVKKIFRAKGRPSDNPLIVHIYDIKQLNDLVEEIPQKSIILAEKFWPGPLTMIFKAKKSIPSIVNAGMNTVAIRMPSNEIARKLIELSGSPIAAPSANTSGAPSPTTAKHVFDDMNQRIPVILDGGECDYGVESTVISIIDKPRLLRPGGISLEQLKDVLGNVEVDPSILNDIVLDKVSSPGMKHKHYSPRANVIIINSSSERFIDFVNKKHDQNISALCFDEEADRLSIPYVNLGKKDDFKSHSHKLFAALRQLDKTNTKTIFAHRPETSGIGLAVYNRLLRAAGFKEITLNDVKTIGVTGPTGSGKSTVCSILKEYGGIVVDADEIAHDILHDNDVIEAISKSFGQEYIIDRKIDRKKLADYVFTSKDKTALLNSITHPKILSEILNQTETIKITSKPNFVILDVPLLFESGLDCICDYTLCILADIDTRAKRIMNRDAISYESAQKRINSQHDNEYYHSNSDYSLCNNDCDIEEIKNKIEGMLKLWQIYPQL